MTKELLNHFKKMQGKAAEYLEPGPYENLMGAECPDGISAKGQFLGDMLYMLDGPEQRAAQALAEFDFIEEAQCTLSNRYHGEKVTLAAARQIFDDFIRAGQRMDALKKALFYGKGEDIGPTNALGMVNMHMAPLLMAGFGDRLTISAEEREEVEKSNIILHALVGIATESVEGIEALYKAIWGEHPIDRVNVLEESGDAFWYHGVLFKALGSDFDTEQRRNIAKLRKRFPDGFTEYDAKNRDLGRERATLENHGLPPEHVEALLEASPLTDPDVIEAQAERFATRCPDCGLSNNQHRPQCGFGVGASD